ncbi:MAG: hypothetical protein EPO24_07220 [Bacteroidetes bacterium]|nr:MAG: hypothetical protein EPO24_07220 [Bacteroidota bacterium]
MANSISISHGQTFPREPQERRLIFNGETVASKPKASQRVNGQVSRRRLSPMLMIVSVLSVALVSVMFIWNTITVNKLAGDLNKMQIEYQNIVGKNELLKAEVNQKSTPERIQKLAYEQLGLTVRKEQPVMFELEK